MRHEKELESVTNDSGVHAQKKKNHKLDLVVHTVKYVFKAMFLNVTATRKGLDTATVTVHYSTFRDCKQSRETSFSSLLKFIEMECGGGVGREIKRSIKS